MPAPLFDESVTMTESNALKNGHASTPSDGDILSIVMGTKRYRAIFDRLAKTASKFPNTENFAAMHSAFLDLERSQKKLDSLRSCAASILNEW